MKQPWFATYDRVLALNLVARGWIGTPWVPNSSVRGPTGGVACHTLPAAIYRECGFLPEGWTPPAGDPKGTRFGAQFGVIEPWLDGRPEFARVDGAGFAAGDLLGFRFYHGIDHLGVMVNEAEGIFIHVLSHSAAAFHSVLDATWLRRLTKVWRPVHDA